MLEYVPKVVGELMQGARAGHDKVVSRSPGFREIPATITLTSPAFARDAILPARFTEDGAKVSPPLTWTGLPAETRTLVLVIEDPDAPTPEPLVHCIAWDLPAGDGGLAEGALKSPAHAGTSVSLGQNSFFKSEYLPPDPPTGHGPHSYVFQLFALDRKLDLAESPGRSAVVDAMKGHVLAMGTLIGLYERT